MQFSCSWTNDGIEVVVIFIVCNTTASLQRSGTVCFVGILESFAVVMGGDLMGLDAGLGIIDDDSGSAGLVASVGHSDGDLCGVRLGAGTGTSDVALCGVDTLGI